MFCLLHCYDKIFQNMIKQFRPRGVSGDNRAKRTVCGGWEHETSQADIVS
jgi:hypothetical protein